MTSPFNIKRTTKVGRNGFDMSQRHLFNAYPGALIPVMVEECLFGDTHRISLSGFTRLRNIKTAAFARFKEYYDFFFVPHELNWPYFNKMLVNNDEPASIPVMGNTSNPTMLPYFSYRNLFDTLKGTGMPALDDMGVSSFAGTNMLCDMLGYSPINRFSSEVQAGEMDYYVNPLAFAAYQRIYQDYYRNPQWERRNPLSYNLNPFYTSGSNEIPLHDLESLAKGGMFTMRYANWHKDYFMGLYPNQQFGDVSVVNSNFLGQPSAVAGDNPLFNDVGGRSGVLVDSGNDLPVYSSLSIVDLRRAQALQRWKEVTMTNGSSTYQQIKAHFGFDLPEGNKDAVEYIGGLDNIVSIQDVDATAAGNAGSDNTSYLGQVGGKGLGVSDSSRVIEFTSKNSGLLMCIYHCVPILDYNAVGLKKFNSKLESSDFYLPEFDKIGFGTVNKYELLTTLSGQVSYNDTPLGYTSRYMDYKTSYDRVHGSFAVGASSNYNDAAWAVALTEGYLNTLIDRSGSVDYRFFKVNPFVANNIMIVPLSNPYLEATSPFMVSADFRYYKVSNMSVDSLPY